MSKNFVWVAFALAALFGGCNQGPSGGNDPKQRLTEYISKSFAVKDTAERKDLVSYLTGDSKARLESWSDDQFRAAFIDSKRQFIKLAYKDVKTVSPTETDITYELTYVDQGKGHNAKVTNKKLCMMVLDQGKWLIADVRNIKELVEYQNEMSLP